MDRIQAELASLTVVEMKKRDMKVGESLFWCHFLLTDLRSGSSSDFFHWRVKECRWLQGNNIAQKPNFILLLWRIGKYLNFGILCSFPHSLFSWNHNHRILSCYTPIQYPYTAKTYTPNIQIYNSSCTLHTDTYIYTHTKHLQTHNTCIEHVYNISKHLDSEFYWAYLNRNCIE